MKPKRTNQSEQHQVCPNSDPCHCLEPCSLWNYRPVILDPADPTWDVGNGTAWRWDVLAKEAESCLNQRCFRQPYGAPEQPWEGPVSERTPGSSGLMLMSPGLWGSTVGAMGVSPSSGLEEEHWSCLWCPPLSGYVCPPRSSHSYLPIWASVLLYTKTHISLDSLPSPSLSHLSCGQRD